MESTIANFVGSSFARIKPFGRGLNKENLGRRSNSNKFNRVFRSHPTDLGMWKIATNKSSDQLEGAVNGDYEACDMHLEEQGGAQVQVEGAELELTELGKEPISDQ